MQCFRVRADTLEPISSSSYYDPSALTDPRGPQMSIGEWLRRRADQREAEFQAWRRAR
jgi:hypothetical protein